MTRFVTVLFLVLFCCCTAIAQMPSNAPRGAMPGFNLQPPRALSGDWWRDPEIVNELHLSDAQRKQLEQVSLTMKLSLINAAATAATAVVKGESALNGDQLDESAYNQQVTTAADAASKLAKDIGGTLLAMRKILTPEQWRKLESMRRRAPEARRQAMPREYERRPTPPQE